MRGRLTSVSVLTILLVIGILTVSCGRPSLPTEPRTTPSPIPRSLKGYELYIWEDSERLWMTLITGTNRKKSALEIFSLESTEASDGWFKSTVEGLDQGLALLDRLPPGETVILGELPGVDGSSMEIDPQPPSPEIFLIVEEYCRENGLQLLSAGK